LNRQKLDDGVKAAFEQRKGRDGARLLQVELAENVGTTLVLKNFSIPSQLKP
jgi:hypothetical protein